MNKILDREGVILSWTTILYTEGRGDSGIQLKTASNLSIDWITGCSFTKKKKRGAHIKGGVLMTLKGLCHANLVSF